MSASLIAPHHLARALLLGALVLLGPGACRSITPSRAATQTLATLRLENPGEHGWRIELAPDSHGIASRDALRWELPAHAKQNVTVPAGTYHLRSRPAGETNGNDSAAFERIDLQAGATRLWTPAARP